MSQLPVIRQAKGSVELAIKKIATRFDKSLGRMHKKGDTQRGLILFANGECSGT